MNGLEPSGPGRSLGLTRWGAFLPASSEAPLPALLTTQMFFLGCRPVRLPGGVPTPFSETLLGQNLGGLQATSLSCDLCGQARSALIPRTGEGRCLLVQPHPRPFRDRFLHQETWPPHPGSPWQALLSGFLEILAPCLRCTTHLDPQGEGNFSPEPFPEISVPPPKALPSSGLS